MAVSGTTIERKTSRSRMKVSPENERQHGRRQLVDQTDGVEVERRLTGHVHGRAPIGKGLGDHLGP